MLRNSQNKIFSSKCYIPFLRVQRKNRGYLFVWKLCSKILKTSSTQPPSIPGFGVESLHTTTYLIFQCLTSAKYVSKCTSREKKISNDHSRAWHNSKTDALQTLYGMIFCAKKALDWHFSYITTYMSSRHSFETLKCLKNNQIDVHPK